MSFEKEQILAQLDRIISDKTFSRSKINVRLLSFLVKATLEGDDIKETSIGTAFFGSKYDPIKFDNKVRVYVYHLRKKLEDYYDNTAKENDIIFSIAKGQYKVGFDEYHKKKPQSNTIYRNIFITIAALVILILALLIYEKPVDSFWKPLMSNNLSTSVVFGDYFTMSAPIITGGNGMVRDFSINTEDDLKNYLAKNPEQEDQIQACPQHYFNWIAPYCSKAITEFWMPYNYAFEIIKISEWSVSQLENENMVYFGQSKSMGVLKSILQENFPQFTYKNEAIIRMDSATNKNIVYKDIVRYDDKMTDYTVVAKIALPTGNEMRFFLSDQDCGAISALQYFTEKDSIDAFYKRYHLEEDDDFLALFKVTGWQRKSYEMEFVLLDVKE